MTIKVPRLLTDGLLNSFHRSPSKNAAIIEGTPYTYAELHNGSRDLSYNLLSKGLKKGDRVAIYMDNTWHCIVSIYGILMAGGTFLLINPQTKHEKLDFILRDSGASILLSDSHLTTALNKLIKAPPSMLELLIYSGERQLENTSPGQLDVQRFSEIDGVDSSPHDTANIIASDLAALIYTSGSTGEPKGVMHTHLSMVFALTSIIEYLRLDESDRILNVLPLSFDYGLYQLLMSVWLGATLVLERSFTYPARILQRLVENKVTVFPGVPTIFSMLIAQYKNKPYTLDSISKITNTAAALSSSMITPLKAIFPNALIFKMYGLTECKRTCYLEPELIDTHADSVGKAIPGTEVFLMSPDGQRLGPGDTGILHVRGPHLMLGYWNRPEQSAEMLIPGALPNERYLCTHDWFRMDRDGFLYFVGRNDDIIKSRGEKVSPIEVENALLSLDGISEAAVIGVPDELLGQAIKAFITLAPNSDLNDKVIRKFCMSRLENFMVPKYIEFIQTMPKSANGKIDKKALSSMVSE
jgi:long-chain acyl-CoA synthetase